MSPTGHTHAIRTIHYPATPQLHYSNILTYGKHYPQPSHPHLAPTFMLQGLIDLTDPGRQRDIQYLYPHTLTFHTTHRHTGHASRECHLTVKHLAHQQVAYCPDKEKADCLPV
ncbi:Hypothetical predicted protein [Pelobates cultripes]|uniref:Uncharacterized protein n=1 Tax=Pelobates cultripes TaxID=61616 RepID=A0AAD1W165_PELCU|nr:Hypothetical predicted protein [Pelobates cultripes]